MGLSGCETYCIFPPDPETGRIPAPSGKCLNTGSTDPAKMVQEVEPHRCAATAMDISQCPNFPLRLNVVLGINHQRTLLNTVIGAQDLAKLKSQFKYPIVATVDIPFTPGSSLLGLHWSRVSTSKWLISGAKRYNAEMPEKESTSSATRNLGPETHPTVSPQPGMTTRSQCDRNKFWCRKDVQNTHAHPCIVLTQASWKPAGGRSRWHSLKSFEICPHSDPRCTTALGSESQERHSRSDD